MSDTISMIYSEFEDYELLCKKLRIDPIPLGIDTGWYKHFLELQDKEKQKKL